MVEAQFQLLKFLSGNPSASQRVISKEIGLSLGKVNSLIKELDNEGLMQKEINESGIFYRVTQKGMKELEHNINQFKLLRLDIHEKEEYILKEAVILAAGERRDFNIPTSLLQIEEFLLIERTINILIKNKFERIIIIAGYKAELFNEIEAKYKEVEIVFNNKYYDTGTMDSIYSAKETISGDFLLIESDLIFEEEAIKMLVNFKERDCILLSDLSGSDDEALVEIRDGYLYKIAKDIHQLNSIHGEFVGITKISYKLYLLMLKEYGNNTNPYINYEYTLLDVARNYNVGFITARDQIWGEIDTLEQYEKIKNEIYPKIKNKEEKRNL